MTEASRNPLVSVVVCVFNGEEFLKETLGSALAQTHERLELVVVDDGSSDGSVALVEGHADPRISLLRQEHGGAACALAAGLGRARGEYIAFLDQDDLWERDKLATHVERMRGRPEIDLTFSWFRYIDSSGQDIGRGSIRYRGTIDFRGLLTDFVIGATSNVVARRAAIGAAGGVDTAFPRVYDLDLFLRIARLAPENMEAIPRYLMRYRRHDEQITRDSSTLEREWEQVVAKMRLIAPADVEAVLGAARMNVSRFFARLAYEQRCYGQALRYVARGFSSSPARFVADGRNWLAGAACLSGLLLTPALHRGLERMAGLKR